MAFVLLMLLHFLCFFRTRTFVPYDRHPLIPQPPIYHLDLRKHLHLSSDLRSYIKAANTPNYCHNSQEAVTLNPSGRFYLLPLVPEYRKLRTPRTSRLLLAKYQVTKDLIYK